ncbi:MAG: T9SS type A sorting domain-containing protein [Sphingobacteriales bacterium]|nr:MAG: T9SS type A sorting domain-containing protein [Sphingobacteriales bacterium]
MKRIYTLVLFALLCQMASAQSFFMPTSYRGAFAPSPAAMWTDNWTEFDPQNKNYGSSNVDVTGNITTNTTWTANNIYLLKGQVYVKNGAVLTIEAGTIIMGDKNASGAGLFICKGSKINAKGTASKPIVFTSNQGAGSRSVGDWGGIILMGKASNNNPGGKAYVEGIAPNDDTEFGGGTNPDDNDNSGVMQYVRIEFGGYVYQPNKEINGLTLGAVGRGTTLNHIQVSFSNDDAYEFFGGTVNARYLVSFRNLDDDFDTDNGFNGNIQFGLVVRDPKIADNPSVSTSESFESDNDASGSTAKPQTSAIFSNITLIGPYRGDKTSTIASGYRRGARIRRNSALNIINSVFMDYPTGVHIDGALSETNATNGDLKFMNNIVAGSLTGKFTEVNSGSSFNAKSWFGSNNNDSVSSSANILSTPYNYTSPDYRPATSSAALSGADFTNKVIAALTLFAPTVTNKTVTYCEGETATVLSATATSGNTLNWYTSSTGGNASTTAPTPSTTVASTTKYYVSQFTEDGMESERTEITVIVNAAPATPLVTASGPTSFCKGGKITLSAPNATFYMWSTGATTQTIDVTESGNYTVTVKNANGCQSTSAATTVEVGDAPKPTINMAGATNICPGDSLVLTSSVADDYMWSNGATTRSITVKTAGTYFVTATNANPCNGTGKSSEVVVNVNTAPVANGSAESRIGNVVKFVNASTSATSYLWDFGDSTSSTSANPSHAYANDGDYKVTLTAYNATCKNTFSFNTRVFVGIEEKKAFTGINLFPNPAKGESNLEVNLLVETQVLVRLTDITGKVIETIYNGKAQTGTNRYKINVSQLNAGLYFVNISTGNTNKTIKLIVQ